MTLEVGAGTPGPSVSGDTDRLLEAVMNLLDNALRHTPSGGSVTVAVDALAPEPDGPGRARLTVTDTGDGFDPDLAPLLFERFYRGDRARHVPAEDHDTAPAGSTAPVPGRHGSGIGLTITRAIVEAHHGTIGAGSAGPGRGATFTMVLPAVRSPVPRHPRSR